MAAQSKPCADAGTHIPRAPLDDEIWKEMDRTPAYLRGTDFEYIFRKAAEHFAEVYACARGHKIDPAYVAALPHDFLIALGSVLEAAREGTRVAPLTVQAEQSVAAIAKARPAGDEQEGRT